MPPRITKIADLPWVPAGLILDPYAGNRRWWKGSDTTNVTFTDKYYAIDGVTQADVANLPFPNESFDQIWADPPHLIRKSKFKPSSRFFRCSSLTPEQPSGYFGTYPNRAAVHVEWRAAAKELHRVCRPHGLLIWKSIDGAKTVAQCVNDKDLQCLTDFWELLDTLRYPSVMSWSTATTVYSKWQRR